MLTIDEAIIIILSNMFMTCLYVYVERKWNKTMKKPEWEYIGDDSVEVYRCSCCGCFTLDNSKPCRRCTMPEEKKEKK